MPEKLPKAKRPIIDWEAIRQDHRIQKYPSVRALAKAYGITHPAIFRKIRENKEEWQQDLSKDVKRALHTKLVTKKAKRIVTTLEGGNKEKVEQILKELSNEETVEYAALSDLAFLSDWHRRFLKTLEVVSGLKEELINNKNIRINKDGVAVEEPIGLSVRATVLNAITQAEHRTYQNMRKNSNLDESGQDPEDSEISEADKDDLKRLAVEAAKEVVENG